MGIITGLIKLPFKGIKKGAEKISGIINTKDESSPIIAVVKTNYPSPYEYYFEGIGETTYWKGITIVWKKGVKEEEKKKYLEELNSLI